MPSTAIYLRKSTESDDRQALSLDAQLRWALEACANLRVAKPLIFRESRSAKTPGRPEFARLLTLIEKGEVDTVVTWKADRLARNALDGGRVLYLLESKKLTRIVSSDRTYTDDSDAEFLLNIELGLSAKYSKDLSKNIRRGMREKLLRGEWPFIAPVGYKNVRLTADRAIIDVDGERAPRITELFQLAASGNHSLADLADIASSQWKLQLPQRRANTTKNGISVSSIEHILKNPFYYGAMHVRGEVYQGGHTPLTTKATFDAVQQILRGRRMRAERPKRLEFAFTGLLRCAKCGRQLTGYLKRKKSKQYVYYVCSNRIRRRCAQPLVRESEVYSELYPILYRATLTAAEHETVQTLVADMERNERTALDTRRNAAAERLHGLVALQKRLLDLLMSDTITKEDYNLKRRELAAEYAEQSLVASSVEMEHAEKFARMREFFLSLVDAANVFDRLSVAERKAFCRTIGFELRVDGKKLHVDVKKPVAIVMSRGELPEWWRLLLDVSSFYGPIQV